jgi:hypothetical protein
MANLAFIGWIIGIIAAFPRFPAHRVIIFAFVGGELFLPVVKRLPGFDMPEPFRVGPLFMLTKINVISLSCLFAVLIHDSQKLLGFRPRWFDVPMMLWCIAPALSDALNGEAINDIYGQTRDQILQWGVPYLLGRLYLTGIAQFRDLAMAIMIGALVYAPFCVIEMLRGPYWHERIYGYFQHDLNQMEREGGIRPMVFMEHGLELGLWMSLAAMVGFWMWRTGAIRHLSWNAGSPPVPMIWVATALFMLAVVVKSSGALILGMFGIATYYVVRWVRLIVVMAALMAIPTLFIGARISDALNTKQAAGYLEKNFGKERAQSVMFRFENEDKLIPRTLQQPWFGWGDIGQGLKVVKKRWEAAVVPDSQWIITFNFYGYFGLLTLHLGMLLPSLLIAGQYSPQKRLDPEFAAVAVLAIFIPIFMLDCLLNAMINPVYILTVGGLASIAAIRPAAEPEAMEEGEIEVEGEPESAEGEESSEEQADSAPPGVLVRRRPFAR